MKGSGTLASLRRAVRGALEGVLEGTKGASRSPRVVLGAALLALWVAAASLTFALRSPRIEVRLSAGDDLGRRHQIARVLKRLAAERRVDVELVSTDGSAESLERVDDGRLDLALVQGGLPERDDVREVAPLALEPLHLLVRDPSITSLADLRGRTVDLSPPGSGTSELSLALLALTGLRPGRDFEAVSLSYDQLRASDPAALPDAVFHVSTLPSPIAEFLIGTRGFRLVPLPYAGALRLRDRAVREGAIPAFAYGAAPAVPAEDLRTLATRMLLVAHRDTDPEAIRRLLEIIASDRFARASDIAPLHHDADFAAPELTLHPSTVEWLHRNDPLISSDAIESVENMRSFIVSLIVALFLGWRWFRARQQRGFDAYLDRVTELEREVTALELRADLDLPALLRIRRELNVIKTEALEGYGGGKIGSADLLNSFLAHVTDVRAHLGALILHERERLENKARHAGEREEDVMRGLWNDAVGELDDER